MRLVQPLPPDTAESNVRVEGAMILHLCPFKDEVDEGTITIEWIARSTTFELHELASYFATFANKKISHEQLTGDIFAYLARQPEGPIVLRVATHWRTAGMNVTIQRP